MLVALANFVVEFDESPDFELFFNDQAMWQIVMILMFRI